MNDPFPEPRNPAQLQQTLSRLRDEDVPAAMRAAIWRTAYREFGTGNEGEMHACAYTTGLGNLTGADWRYPRDIAVYEQGRHADDLTGVRDVQYYRGYQLGVAIAKTETGQWSCWATIADASYRLAFSAELGLSRSLEAAYAMGMQRCKDQVGMLIAGTVLPRGSCAARKLLNGKDED